MIGIYKITNKINKKSYIGQSVNIEHRWNSHKTNYLNKNIKDYNTKFYKALRKYGIENFDFEILEKCNKNNLNEREIYWINFYNSFKDGYNSTLGGQLGNTKEEHHPMAKVTNEKIIEIKEKLKNTLIIEYDLAKEYELTQSEISNINSGKTWSTIRNYGYPIRRQGRKGEKSPRAYFLIKKY